MTAAADRPPCSMHTGVDKAIENLEKSREDHDATAIRVWSAIEKKVSTKLFLTILTIAVGIVGIFNAIFFYSQDRIFTSYDSTLAKISDKQDKLMTQVTDLRLDIRNGTKPHDSGG